MSALWVMIDVKCVSEMKSAGISFEAESYHGFDLRKRGILTNHKKAKNLNQ